MKYKKAILEEMRQKEEQFKNYSRNEYEKEKEGLKGRYIEAKNALEEKHEKIRDLLIDLIAANPKYDRNEEERLNLNQEKINNEIKKLGNEYNQNLIALLTKYRKNPIADKFKQELEEMDLYNLNSSDNVVILEEDAVKIMKAAIPIVNLLFHDRVHKHKDNPLSKVRRERPSYYNPEMRLLMNKFVKQKGFFVEDKKNKSKVKKVKSELQSESFENQIIRVDSESDLGTPTFRSGKSESESAKSENRKAKSKSSKVTLKPNQTVIDLLRKVDYHNKFACNRLNMSI